MRTILTAVPFLMVLSIVGCPSSDNPSGPSGPTATPTATSTATPCQDRIGKTSASNSGYHGGRFGAQPITVTSTVTLVQLALPLTEVDPDGQLQLAVYEDSSGNPGDLVVGSSPQGMVEGLNVVDIPDTALAPGNYWLAYLVDGGAGGGTELNNNGNVRQELDVLGVNIEKFYNSNDPPIGSLPDPFGAAADSVLAFVVYGIYCP